MNVWTLTTIFLVVIAACLGVCLRNSDKHVEKLKKELTSFEKILRSEGAQTCCNCGKPYNALNDPDYSPELNLCRDCLWKMYYGQLFGEDDS